jgi:uncharacterized surface protein with fasciclin (FAS1) repeats
MRNYVRKLISLVAIAVAFFFSACSTEDITGSTPAPNPNIAEIVARDPNLSLLNAAINRANLSSALAAENITLLAPDNYSFYLSGIPDVNAINAIPVPTLQSILSYHVISKRVPFSAVPVSDTLKTANSQNVYASSNRNGTFFNGTTIKAKDRQGSNGYIQVVEKLLTPPAPTKSIASAIGNDTTFSMLFAAVTKLNLLPLLNNANKLTVFAPNNAAFRAVGITDINAVPTATLDAVVKAHVVGTNIWSTDLENTAVYNTANPAARVVISTIPAAGVKQVSSTQPVSLITSANNACTNGIIHPINRVML